MFKGHCSYRDFAKRAGISPQRLSELVKEGKVHVDGAGMVPESEFDYFWKEKLKKGVRVADSSYLCISINKTQEELAEMREDYVKKHDKSIECSSIDSLLSKLKVGIGAEFSDEALKSMFVKYKARILKELVKRMREAVLRQVGRLVETEEIGGGFPMRDVYELLMYDKVYGGNEEALRVAMKSGVSPSPLSDMDVTFKNIVVSLNVVDNAGKPLVKRSDLNPDAVREIAKMSDGKPTTDNDFVKKFFDLPIGINSGAKGRRSGGEAAKILDDVNAKAINTEMSMRVSSAGAKGFHTFFNITEGMEDKDFSGLIDDIVGGFYKNIDIVATEHDMRESFPSVLGYAISACKNDRSVLVKTLIRDE